MRFKFSEQLLGWLLISVLGTTCFGQIQLDIQRELLDKADELAFDLVQLRANLPEKWAALQERTSENLAKLDAFEIGQTQITEFTAHHRKENVTVARYKYVPARIVGTKVEPGLEFETFAYRKPGLNLFKIQREAWKIVPKIPNIGYPSTDPFTWCLANHVSSRTGTLNDRFLDFFFADTRVCIHAKETNDGLVSVWGMPHPEKISFTTTILFDKHTKLPVKLDWDYFPKGYDPKKFLQMEHETFEKVTVEWKEFQDGKKPLHLPVRIEIVTNGAGPNAELVEVLNRIRWLLNDDVPDSLFTDPQNRDWVEPQFPAYPEEK